MYSSTNLRRARGGCGRQRQPGRDQRPPLRSLRGTRSATACREGRSGQGTQLFPGTGGGEGSGRGCGFWEAPGVGQGASVQTNKKHRQWLGHAPVQLALAKVQHNLPGLFQGWLLGQLDLLWTEGERGSKRGSRAGMTGTGTGTARCGHQQQAALLTFKMKSVSFTYSCGSSMALEMRRSHPASERGHAQWKHDEGRCSTAPRRLLTTTVTQRAQY